MDKRNSLRVYCAFAVALVVASCLSGCYSQREIEQTGFVLAIGLDEGQERLVRLVAQVAVPAAIAGEGDGAGGKQQSAILLTAEGHTISEAILELSKVSPARLFWGHADIIVLTLRYLEAGLHGETDTFLREREFRPAARVYATRDELDEVFAAEFPTQSGNAIYIDNLTTWREIHSTSPQVTASDVAVMLTSWAQAVLVPLLSLDESTVIGNQASNQKLLRLEGSSVVDAGGLVAELTGDETRGVPGLSAKCCRLLYRSPTRQRWEGTWASESFATGLRYACK